MRDVLLFASLIKEIDFILKLQGDTLIVPHSLFKNAVKIHEDSQGAIALTVAPQMWPRTKHITIKYHHIQSFVANGDIEIKHVDTKEQITDILLSR